MVKFAYDTPQWQSINTNSAEPNEILCNFMELVQAESDFRFFSSKKN